MNFTTQRSVESNTSEEWEALHRIYDSVFATTVLPLFYFTITTFGLAGNCFIFFVILKLSVSNTFNENQNLFEVTHKMIRNSAHCYNFNSLRCYVFCK